MQDGFYVYDPDPCLWWKSGDWTSKLGDATCFRSSREAFAAADEMPDDIMVLEVKSQ